MVIPVFDPGTAMSWGDIAKLSVLVTGASGFIGANFLHELVKRGNRPTALLRPNTSTWRLRTLDSCVRYLRVDITDVDAVHRAFHDTNADVVIHAATHGAYAYQRDFETIVQVTLSGTKNVLDAAIASGTKLFINLGSSSEYGPKSDSMCEADIALPDREYGLCKLAQTHLCRNYSSFAMRVVTLRLFSVYGPWEAPGRLIANLLSAGLQGYRFRGSAPKVARDFVWVGDVCDIALDFQRLAQCEEPVINIGTGNQTRIEDLIKVTEDALACDIKVDWSADQQNEWDAMTWQADTRLSHQVLGRIPSTALSDGIRSLIGWFHQNLHHYQSQDAMRHT